jgi:cyclic beta-1,2-glucan synthetase
MQRAGIEFILGLRFEGACLHLEPRISRSWPKYEVMFRHRTARYEIVVENPEGVSQGIVAAHLDGHPITERPLQLPLMDDGRIHRISIRLGLSV